MHANAESKFMRPKRAPARFGSISNDSKKFDFVLFFVTLTPRLVILSRQRRREDLDGIVVAVLTKNKHLAKFMFSDSQDHR